MGIRVAVIGGGGVRTPLLVEELLRRSQELPVAEIRLMDVDRRKLELMGQVIAEQTAKRRDLRLVWTTDPDEAMAGADFIFTMVRVGGDRARVTDELVALSLGVIGQETVGPGGFAMAMRTIPVLDNYAQRARRIAEDAWVINLTNPAGIITQALAEVLGDRVVGVCDSPVALFRDLRTVLPLGEGVPIRFDYVGLNHLGWVTGVWAEGKQWLPWLLEHAEGIRHHGLRLFDPEVLQAVGAIPTEYVYFYYHTERALQGLRSVGRTRGEEVMRLNEELYRRLEAVIRTESVAPDHRSTAPVLAIYRDYIRRREASYFRAEAGMGADAVEPPVPLRYGGGYEKVAADVMSAIVTNARAELTLLVRNRSALPGFDQQDVVEVPCVVDAAGARPVAAGSPPDSVRGLMASVKAHERLTLEAARVRTYAAALRALMAHPLVGSADLARRLLDGYIRAHPGFLEG